MHLKTRIYSMCFAFLNFQPKINIFIELHDGKHSSRLQDAKHTYM